MTLSNNSFSPIGGYFELELPARRELPHAGLQCFQSARAAFLALLRAGKPTKVWMPKYICNAMLAPLEITGVDYVWYDLTDELEVGPEVRLGAGEWLLYVNYFGVCGKKVDALMQRFDPSQIVLDNSQAFFSEPHKHALATIYSPRKFFGVPDGGLLHSQIAVQTPDEIDITSFTRMEYLIRRLGESPEAGYAAYQRAEKSLDDMEPRVMSRLSERIFASIEFEAARKKRLENFQMLHDVLRRKNGLVISTDGKDIPLCYPYRTHDVGLRQLLLANRIFVPTYWSDAIDRLTDEKAENLVRNLLPLPVDQRYGASDMKRISAIILDKQ
jgi:hypothetical protein